MNPVIFIKGCYNHETLLEARKLEKLEMQLAKSRIARIFNLRCLAINVMPKPCTSNGNAVSLNKP